MRYIIGALITVGLIILVLVLIFSGGGPGKQPLVLSDYANTDALARMVIKGPVTAEQTHREIQVDVDQNFTTLTVYSGYQKTVVRSKSYASNQDAYAVFLRALQHQGFTKGNDDPSKSDDRGYCPLGRRYVFSFTNDGKQLERYWTTSCGGGTFGGNTSTIIQLFHSQIPDYSSLTSDVDI